MSSIILEIRPAAGGDEAKIWANDLLRMYVRYANSQNWKVKQLDQRMLKIRGRKVADKLKHEGGVHRVQRVPETETHDRIHTSTATVAVLPTISKRKLAIKRNNVEFDFFRASGSGGQHVNKVSTAVRVTHKPTGITVECQAERSQHRNREMAIEMLRSKLWQREQEKKQAKRGKKRQAQIKSGRRSQKTRSYAYHRNCVTDHRINEKWYTLEEIIDGELEPIISALQKKLG
jgi:peptide chain release factor 1